MRTGLQITELEDVRGDLEYIQAKTALGIDFRIYEDGLITLARDPEGSIRDDIELITEYYEQKLSRGLKYIFSLGAPIPKELANIKTVYPYFVVFEKAKPKDIQALLDEFDQEKHFEIKERTFEIYRGDTLYIINSKGEPLNNIERFIGEQIFIREFKAQMHRYLNLHRIIWENIAEVKETGSIKGRNIAAFRSKIEGYEKSINMIDTRINQMGAYIQTRDSILKNDQSMKKFTAVYQYKYETLANTLNYVKEIWKMTKVYVGSALKLFTDLQAQATNNSIKNLNVITSMGVGGTLIGLFAKDTLPTFTAMGVVYFLIVATIGWSANKIMKEVYIRKDYKIRDIQADTNIE